MAVQLLYQGKTKDVYQLENGHILLTFKDDVTGENGKFDPGANTVGLSIEGIGKSGLRVSQYFFEKLQNKGIHTHYINANIDEGTMTVKDAGMFGHGLEFIFRFRAVGSFYRRYGAYCEEGQRLDGIFEVTIKDDERQDPLITKDSLIALNILSEDEYEQLKLLTKRICHVIKEELAKKEMELYDIKLEFGRDKNTGDVMLIDEISGGNMRVYKDGKSVPPMDVERFLLED